ncbi:hypothetical protein V6765_22860 [Martelella sp. FOR1707]
MTAAVGIDVAHDRTKPAAEIFAAPLVLTLESDHQRILQKIVAVNGRSGQSAGDAVKLRQLLEQLSLECGARRRSLARMLRRFGAIMPGAPPASCRDRRSGR